MTPKDWIALLQAAAYVTLACIALVTLRRASRTLLQPIRTEAFKAQLDELRDLMRLMASADEVPLRTHIGFDQLASANAVRLHDRFMRDAFGVQVDESQRPYSASYCNSLIVHDDFLAAHHKGSSHPFRSQSVLIVTPRPGPSEDPRAWWATFDLGELHVPNELSSFVNHLRNMVNSPLLPSSVLPRVKDLLGVIDKNVALLFDVLAKAGRQLPSRYPDAQPPSGFVVDWILDDYYSAFTAIAPRVAALRQSIRDYLASDKLTEPLKH